MTRARITGGMFAALFIVLASAALYRAVGHDIDPSVVFRMLEPDVEPVSSAPPAGAVSTAGVPEGLLYGRITTDDGAIYEGRLRFGSDEEALWGDYFNGFKATNPWAGFVSSDRLPMEHQSVKLFGIEIHLRKDRLDLGRPFMARFGDIALIEPRGRDLRVTLKSGTTFHLDRYGADDVADGLRVWDADRGVVDLGEWHIRTIELVAAPASGAGPSRAGPVPLYGTVHTRHGDFTGFVQWDRRQCLVTDELRGNATDSELSLRFDEIRSIARRSVDSSLVTLLDGSTVLLSGNRQVGRGNGGLYVDDRRYGRVLISWEAFERVDFGPGGTGPARGDYPVGHALAGTVVTRSGRRLAGRLVYDLDESETTETLDAPLQGVDYTIPFALIASIVLPGIDEPGLEQATVTLRSGEQLRLELAGDLGEFNAGVLVFVDGRHDPEYVPWTEVRQIDLDP